MLQSSLSKVQQVAKRPTNPPPFILFDLPVALKDLLEIESPHHPPLLQAKVTQEAAVTNWNLLVKINLIYHHFQMMKKSHQWHHPSQRWKTYQY